MTTKKEIVCQIGKTAGVTVGTLGSLGKISLSIGILLMVAFPSISNAIQPDAEYLVREKQFGEWAAEDGLTTLNLTVRIAHGLENLCVGFRLG